MFIICSWCFMNPCYNWMCRHTNSMLMCSNYINPCLPFPLSEDDNSLPKKQMEVLSEILKSDFFTSVKDVSSHCQFTSIQYYMKMYPHVFISHSLRFMSMCTRQWMSLVVQKTWPLPQQRLDRVPPTSLYIHMHNLLLLLKITCAYTMYIRDICVYLLLGHSLA